MFIKYDPAKHKDKKLYELQTVREGKALVSVFVPTSIPHETASKTPWYYFVKQGEKP